MINTRVRQVSVTMQRGEHIVGLVTVCSKDPGHDCGGNANVGRKLVFSNVFLVGVRNMCVCGGEGGVA